MEAPHHEFIPWEWASWDIGSFGEASGWIPESWGTFDVTNAFLGDATVEPDPLWHDFTLNGYELDPSAVKPLEHIENMDHPGFGPLSTMEAFSPSGSSGNAWSASSAESVFSSPSVPWEILYQPPDLLTSQSPLDRLEPAHNTVVDKPQFPATHAHSANHTNDEASASEAPATLPGVEFKQSPAGAATAAQARNMEAKPPTLSARQRRYRDRPVKCPECSKSFPYMAGWKRHIASRHRHIAHKYHVPTELHACDWCGRSFERKDHLLRHLTKNHGRLKGVRRRRSAAER